MLLGAILATLIGTLQADSLLEGWVPLTFSGPGTFAPQLLIWSLRVGTILQITDTKLVGDRYSVYNGTTFLGSTCLPSPQAANSTTLDPDVAMSSQFGWSNAFILLPSGSYNISVKVEAAGYTDAGAWIRVDKNYST